MVLKINCPRKENEKDEEIHKIKSRKRGRTRKKKLKEVTVVSTEVIDTDISANDKKEFTAKDDIPKSEETETKDENLTSDVSDKEIEPCMLDESEKRERKIRKRDTKQKIVPPDENDEKPVENQNGKIEEIIKVVAETENALDTDSNFVLDAGMYKTILFYHCDTDM